MGEAAPVGAHSSGLSSAARTLVAGAARTLATGRCHGGEPKEPSTHVCGRALDEPQTMSRISPGRISPGRISPGRPGRIRPTCMLLRETRREESSTVNIPVPTISGNTKSSEGTLLLHFTIISVTTTSQ